MELKFGHCSLLHLLVNWFYLLCAVGFFHTSVSLGFTISMKSPWWPWDMHARFSFAWAQKKKKSFPAMQIGREAWTPLFEELSALCIPWETPPCQEQVSVQSSGWENVARFTFWRWSQGIDACLWCIFCLLALIRTWWTVLSSQEIWPFYFPSLQGGMLLITSIVPKIKIRTGWVFRVRKHNFFAFPVSAKVASLKLQQ